MPTAYTRRKTKIDVKSFTRPLLFALGFVYLGFHVLHGERGLYAWFKESHQRTVLEQEFAQLHNERLVFENKVSRLRDQSLDPDLLDEQARRMVGAIGKNERVLLLSPKPDSN